MKCKTLRFDTIMAPRNNTNLSADCPLNGGLCPRLMVEIMRENYATALTRMCAKSGSISLLVLEIYAVQYRIKVESLINFRAILLIMGWLLKENYLIEVLD